MPLEKEGYQKETDQRDFDRGVLESDRNFERGVLESDRNFDRGVFESDREFDQWKAEFDANQLWNEKDYEIAYMNALKRTAPKVTRPTYTGSSYGNDIINDIESKLAPDDEEAYGLSPVTNGNFWNIG